MGYNFPNSPAVNQTFTPSGGPTFQWNGVAWNAVTQGMPVTVYMSDTAPVSPAPGQLWWNSTTGNLSVFYADADSTQWVQVSGAAATVPSRWETIEARAVTGPVASVDFINLGAYRQIRITGRTLIVSSSGYGIQFSSNNGVSFDAGTGYATQNIMSQTTAYTSARSNAALFALNAFNNINPSAVDGISFTVAITEFNKAGYCWLHSQAAYVEASASTLIATWNSGAQISPTTARNAIRFLCNAGNVGTGYYSLEGIKG